MDEEDDRELPDESDMDESDEPELIQCPHCRKYIPEDAEQCHHCGMYISAGNSRASIWTIAGIIFLLVLTVWIFIFRVR